MGHVGGMDTCHVRLPCRGEDALYHRERSITRGRRGLMRYVGLMLLWLLWSPPQGQAASTEHYTGEGGVIIQHDDQASARLRALNAAFQNTIEQVVADLVPPELIVQRAQSLEARLYARPLDYLRSYRVLWEYTDGPYYRLGVEAELAIDALRRSLAGLGIATSWSPEFTEFAEGAPWLLLLIAERPFGQSTPKWRGNRGTFARELLNRLRAYGLDVRRMAPGLDWDEREDSAASTAKAAGFRVVLVGRAGVQQLYSVASGSAVQATVQVRVLDTETGKVVAQERLETKVLQDDVTLANDSALQQAAVELAARLVAPLLAYHQTYGAKTTTSQKAP